MTSKMENHPLLIGLKTRLYSEDYKLDAKVNLITNLYKSDVPIPYKDELILDWIIKNLNQKYLIKHEHKSDNDEDIVKFWTLLDHSLKSIEISATQVDLDKELLLNLADKADLTLQNAANAFLLLMKTHAHEASSKEMLLVYASLLQKSFCPESIINRIINILEGCTTVKEHFGVLLATLSVHCSSLNIENLQQLCRKFIINLPANVDSMLINMHQFEEKFDDKNVFFEYLTHKGNVNILLKSANDSSFLQTRTKLFILFVHLSGKHLVVSKDSLLMAKVDVALNEKPDLKQVLLHSLPLDLEYAHEMDPSSSEKLLVNRILSEVLIDIIDLYKLNEDTYEVLEAIMMHHPIVLETLAPLIVSRSLSSEGGDYGMEIIKLIIDMALRLRQLPKFISKLQMYLKKYDGEVYVNDAYLKVFEDAINQIPRSQNLEIWRTILFHLGDSFFENIEDEPLSRKVCMTCLPILQSVFTSGQLIDHNLPENVVTKLKQLIYSTFTDFLKRVEDPATKAEFLLSTTVYKSFVSDYLEFVYILSLYKNIEFIPIDEYRNKLIESILSKKEISGYDKLVSLTVRNNSKHELEVLKVFARDLSNDLIISNINKLDAADKFSLMSEVEHMDCEENLDCVSVRLFQQFVKFNIKTGKFCDLINKEIWSSVKFGRNTRLLNALRREINNFKKENISPEDLDPDLQSLPIENLPSELKVAATLVSFIHFLVSPTTKSCFQLERCVLSNKKQIINYGFLKQILDVDFEVSGNLLEALFNELNPNTLSKLASEKADICDCIQKARVNYVHFFSLFVRKQSGKSQTLETVTTLLDNIIKSFMKLEISDYCLVHHVQAVRGILYMQQQQDPETDKYVNEVLTASLNTGQGLQLVGHLLEAGEQFKHLGTPDILETAWKLYLDVDVTDNNIMAAIKILECLEPAQRSSFLSNNQHTYKIAMVMTAIKQTDGKEKLTTLEHLVLKIIEEEDVDIEDKARVLLHVLNARNEKMAVSGDVVVAGLCMLMSLQSGYCSTKTATILNIFTTKNLYFCSTKYIHCMLEILRQHLKHLQDADIIDAQEISLLLLQTFKTLSLKRKAWRKFTHFLVADVITASIKTKYQNVKKLLAEIMHVLLDICEHCKQEYISVSLPADANEVFKAMLEEYNTKSSASKNEN